MAIAKMRAVTISGKISDFDRIIDKYVYDRDIHLENALSVIHDKHGLQEFREANEYDGIVKEASSILGLANITDTGGALARETMTAEEMRAYLEKIDESINEEKARDEALRKQIEENRKTLENLKPMSGVDVDLSRLSKMEFIDCVFGHLPASSYNTLQKYLGDSGVIFVVTSQDEDGVWGFRFSSAARQKQVEDLFRTLYFEKAQMPAYRSGTPKQIYDGLVEENKHIEAEIKENGQQIFRLISESKETLIEICNLAKKRQKFYEIKKKAMHTKMLFFIAGWMEKKDADRLEKDISAEGDEVMFYQEDPENAWETTPPTKLKNNPVFKPFEMFVKMYGMPGYKELDPTPILAITYILFFGIMFGDVGQSLVLAIAGFIVYKAKKMDLAGIVGFVGISGVIFGFIYGSFFGNEEIIPSLLHTTPLKPMEQIGVMLGGTIGIGMLVIVFGMILNVINLIKSGRFGECICSHNGVAGIFFYLSVLCIAGNMLLKLGMPTALFAAFTVISLLLMFFEQPVAALIDGKKDWMPKSGMFFVESFFELFEVILSFFSNTISFLRIGAFAIVHVGMMTVVAVLSKGGGVGGAVVQIIGNALVMCLEGLIVGIQVLRLEYYEMFSRYFGGGGKPFVSLRDK